MEGITELRREFARRGWDRKATNRLVLQLLAHVAIAVAGIVVFMMSRNPAVRLAGILVSTLGSMGVGTNTHTSSHFATSDRRWVNEALTYFGYPVFLGLSATFWWHKHVVVHHPSPNVIGVDQDADLSPWFAITQGEVWASRGVRRFYYERLQFWVFPFALLVNGFGMQKSGWIYVIRKLRDPRERKPAHWIDLGALLAHYVFTIGLPLVFWPASQVALLYVARIVLMGYAMYAVLAPGHFPADALRCTKDACDKADYFTIQTLGTVNFRTGLFGRWVCSGLEYQIEHHLFPNISHCFYPQVSVAVREFCREHGLPYRSYSWGRVLWKSWAVLRSPQPVLPASCGIAPDPA